MIFAGAVVKPNDIGILPGAFLHDLAGRLKRFGRGEENDWSRLTQGRGAFIMGVLFGMQSNAY